MKRNLGLFSGFVLLSVTIVLLAAPDAPRLSTEATKIYNSAIVIDTHADTPQRFLDEAFDLGNNDPADLGDLSLEKAHAGNLAAEFFSIWVDPKSNRGRYAHKTLALIDSVYQQAARHPRQMTMAFSAADIERAHADKKFAALMGIEGGHSIENDLSLLREFYRLGVRYMTLTWSNTNEWADSSGDEHNLAVTHHNGLTDFGRQVVLEMNRLGMMVDISHVSDKTFYDVIAISKAPVIASHSAARALTHAPRNMTDDMLRAVGANGGVVQVNFFSAFVDDRYRAALAVQEKEMDAAAGRAVAGPDRTKIVREWMAKIPRPPLRSLIDHIDHVAKTAGIDHVGLGSDFDGVDGATPADMKSAADLPNITQALLDRGYSESDIHKILGGNLLRVFRQVEHVALTLASVRPTP